MTCQNNDGGNLTWTINPIPSGCTNNVSAANFSCVIPSGYASTASILTITATSSEGASVSNTIIVNDAALGSMSVSCNPTSIISGKTTTCTASCSGDTSYTWSVTPSTSGTCSGTAASVSCQLTKTTQDTVTITADSSSCNPATASVSLTDASNVSVTCTPTSPKAGETFSCTSKCGGVDEEVTWSSSNCGNQTGTSMSCKVNAEGTEIITATPVSATSNCTTKTTNLVIASPDALTASCTNVTKGGTTTCTSDIAATWDFQDSQLASCDSSASLSTVNCFVPYDYNGSSIVNVVVTEVGGAQRSTTVQLVIAERSLSDLTITCDSDPLARQDFNCSAKCGSSNESVSWDNSECTTGPASSTVCQFPTSGSKTITATPTSISSNCETTTLGISVEEPEAAVVTCT